METQFLNATPVAVGSVILFILGSLGLFIGGYAAGVISERSRRI